MKKIVILILLAANLICANAETSTSWINPCDKDSKDKNCDSIQNGIDNLIHQIKYLHATKVLLKYNTSNQAIAYQTEKSVKSVSKSCQTTLELNNNDSRGVEAILNY